MTTGQRPIPRRGYDGDPIEPGADNPPPPHTLNPKCPPALSDLTMQLLEKQPAQRPASADDVAQRLAKLATPVVEAMSRAEVASANDLWSHLEDSVTPDMPMATPVKPEAQAKAKHRKRGILPVVAIGLLLLLIGAGGFAGYKLYFETKNGTLVVDVHDQETELRFKNGELQILDADGKRVKYTLKPSERNKTLPEGKYLVKVIGADGVELDTDRFEIKNGSEWKLRVKAKAPAVANKKPAKTFTNSLGMEFVLVPKGKSWLGGGGGKQGNKEVEIPPRLLPGQVRGDAGGMAEADGAQSQ